MNVSVIGLGKLGAPLAGVLAHAGYTVVGVDVSAATVQAINGGHAPVQEPGLEDLIGAVRDRLSATTDCAQAVAQTEATFVIVPTPSDANGAFSMQYAVAAAEAIGAGLAQREGYHLVVLVSTVMPGATAGAFQPALERSSGKRCGTDFGVCYSPEFIALGSVIRNLRAPDLLLIGESDPRAGELLEGIYGPVHESRPVVRRMNFVNAELTKLAVNTFVTTKISYANMLAQMCERLPGADVDVVTASVGQDSRIGPKFLTGATAYGGPCFPRDNVAFSHLAHELGTEATLAEATHRLNERQGARLADVVAARVPRGGRVAILGLAYKPDTNVVEESPGIAVAQALLARDATVAVYDPAAMPNARRVLGDRIAYTGSAVECTQDADAVVLMTAWPEFREWTPPARANGRAKPVVVDCWRMLNRDRLEQVADYVPLGIGPPERDGDTPGLFHLWSSADEVAATAQPEPVPEVAR